MADRVVKVTLRAMVQDYNASMLKAAQATKTVGTEAEKLAQRRQSFEQLGRAAMTAGGVMAAGVGIAVKRFMDFDAAMSNVAATGQDARDSLDQLRQAAIDAGARTVFSATESANAIEEMAKAGVDAADILGGGLNGALDLAAAGGLDVASAAGIAATALKVFNLEGSDMGRVADLLAAGAGKAMGDVSDLSAALAQGGQVAAATGLTIEETTAALASFASQGLLGSDAGTSLKTMLQRLNPTTKEAQDQFDKLGVSAYDANGQFVGLANFSGQLQTAMKDMTPEARNAAMAVMFGSDAVRAANVLYSEGESGIREWISAVDDQGYAAETARTRLDNLKGDIEALGGAFDSALISMGEGANGPLRALVQGLTELVDGFNDLPSWAQQTALGVAALASAVGLAGGGFLLAVPKLAEFNAAIAAMPAGAQRASRALGVLSKSVGVLSVAAIGLSLIDPTKQWLSDISGYSEALNKAVSGTKTLEESIDSLGARGDIVNLDGIQNAFEGLTKLDSNWFSRFTSDFDSSVSAGVKLQAVLGDLGKELGTLAGSDLMAAQAQFRAWAEATDGSDEQLRALLNSMPEYRAALDEVLQRQNIAVDDANRLKYALGDTPPVVADNTDALRELAGQAESTGDEVEGLADQIRGFGSATLDTRDAQRQFEQAFDDLSASIKDNGATLDVATQKGRDNEAALDDLAKSTFDYAAAIYEQTGSQEQANAVIASGRKRLIDMLGQLNITGAEAEAYADKLGLIPDNVNTAVRIETDAAQGSINRLISNNNGRRITLNVVTNESTVRFSNGSVATSRATGGAILGPGTATSDSIPAWLSNGEHVLTAADVAAMGGQAGVYSFRRALHDGNVAAFASGGAVSLQRAQDLVARAEAKVRRARTKKARNAAREELADAREDLADVRERFRQETITFNEDRRRGDLRAAGLNGNGMSLVDQLLQLGTDVGGKRGASLTKQALRSEKAYLKLEKAADKAAGRVEASASKLDTLRDKVRSWASSVADAFKRSMDPSQWQGGSRQVTSSRVVDGVSVTSVTTQNVPMTATAIAAGSKANAAKIKRVADKLTRLRKMGYNPGYVLEIANMGVEGEPLIDALLAATSSEMQAINKSWSAGNRYSKDAGLDIANAQTLEGKSYRELVASAEKALQNDKAAQAAIQKQLKAETDRIIKAIAGGLSTGLRKASGGPIVGPGTATSDSIPAWLSNGENVWAAADVQRFGGQAAVERLKHMRPTAQRYAHGGPVTAGRDLAPVNLTVVNPVVRDAQKDLNELVQVAGRARRL